MPLPGLEPAPALSASSPEAPGAPLCPSHWWEQVTWPHPEASGECGPGKTTISSDSVGSRDLRRVHVAGHPSVHPCASRGSGHTP